uniref:Uncharacterized protein n=1 Tax=Ditylenchus dipsaci TaxID=166011 RepID=A0A915D4L9_9BILA
MRFLLLCLSVIRKVVSTEQPVVVLSICAIGGLSQVISQVYVQAISLFHSARWNHHFFRSPIRFVMDFSCQSCVNMRFVFYLKGKILSEIAQIDSFGMNEAASSMQTQPSTSNAMSSGRNEPNSFPHQEIKHKSIDKDGPKFFNLTRAKARIRKHVDNKKKKWLKIRNIPNTPKKKPKQDGQKVEASPEKQSMDINDWQVEIRKFVASLSKRENRRTKKTLKKSESLRQAKNLLNEYVAF